MKIHRPWMAASILALLLAGCGSAGNGTAYYYANNGARRAPAPAVTPVVVQPAPAREDGPAGVARIVYFDFDRYDLKPEYRSVVEAHATYLKSHPANVVVLEGHTDPRGSAEYNLALGQRRAETVRSTLQMLGVPDSRLEAVSYGEEHPASTQADEAGYALDRRVELRYR